MSFLRSFSLKQKLLAIIMMTSSVALLLACAAFATYEYFKFRENMLRDLSVKADVAGDQSTAALQFRDPKPANEILQKLSADSHIMAACIYGRDGRVFAQFTRPDVKEGFTPPERESSAHYFKEDALELFRPIKWNGRTLGTLYLKSDLLELRTRLRQFAKLALCVLLVSAGVAWLLSFRLQKIVSQPVLDLAKTTRAVSAGKNYSLRAVKRSNDELGELIDGFNEMLAQIQLRDAELEQARKHLEERVEERTRELQQEITDRRQAEEQLTTTAGRLERSNRELQDFAYVASHDLQEPLRKVQAFGDRLKAACAKSLGAEGLDYLERMHSAAKRMQTLIDDLLTFSRVTTKANPFEQVDLNQIVREVLSDLEVRMQQAKGRVETSELPALEADPLQMRQLFLNLIGNALKFHQKDRTPIVKIRGQPASFTADRGGSGAQNGESWQILVEDNGIGFDEKYRERIFVLFQRLHGRSAYEGTGIGLAICRKIADRHGGTITARSAPGEGSTFTVTLPLRQPQPGSA